MSDPPRLERKAAPLSSADPWWAHQDSDLGPADSELAAQATELCARGP